MNRVTRLGATALLVVGSLLIALALVELVLRAVTTEQAASGGYWGRGAFVAFPTTGYRHTPGFQGLALRPGVFACPVEIDELGLRQADRVQQMAFVRRVLVLGDSFPFGLGVQEHESLPALLRTPLNAAGIGVINGAQTGYCLSQFVAWSGWLLPRVRPDAVLLTVFLDNDVEGEFFSQWRHVDVVAGYRLPVDRRPKGTLADVLRTRTRIGLLVSGSINRLQQRRMEPSFDRMVRQDQASVLDAAAAPIVELAERSHGDGVALGVVMIPPRDGSTRFDDGFRSRLERAGIAVLNLSGHLRPEHYFRGDGHWNAAGHATAATLVAGFVERVVEGRSSR